MPRDEPGTRLPLKADHYELRIRPDSPNLLLIFPGAMKGEHGDLARRYRSQLPASRLCYTNLRPEWERGGFPGLLASSAEMLEEVKRLVAQSGARRVFALGISYGGFGALLAGCALGAERIVVLSGEGALGLPGTRSEAVLRGRLPDHVLTDLRPVIAARGAGEIHMFCGERDPRDMIAASYLADLPGVRQHVLRGVGHNVLLHFREYGGMGALLAGTVSGRIDPAALPRRAVHDLRGEAGALLRAGFAALGDADGPAAEAAFRQLARALPESPVGWAGLGRALARQGRMEAAAEAYRAALALDEDPATVLGIVAPLRALRRHGEALALLDRVLRAGPENPRLEHLRSQVAAEAGAPATLAA